MKKDELLNLTWKEADGSLYLITPRKMRKFSILLNYELYLKETGKISSFSEFRRISITRNSWNRFVNHPNQQKLVDFHDKIFYAKTKIEEPQNFLPDKEHSPKTSKMDLSSKTEESSF